MAGNILTLARGTIASGIITDPKTYSIASANLPLNSFPSVGIAQTGSLLRFAIAAGTNSGTVSSTITVPDDATFVAVSISTFEGGTTASYISGGSMTFTKGGADTAMTLVGGGDTNPANMTGAMAYLALPDTGANKTLKYDFAGTVVSGFDILIAVTFWKGINTTSPVRSSSGTQSGAVPFTSGTLTCLSGDLILASAFNFALTGTDSTIDSWSNLTLLSQLANSNGPDLALATGSPTGNTTVAASTGTNTGDGGICAIVLKPASLTQLGSVSADVWKLKSFLNATLLPTSSLTAVFSAAGTTTWQGTAVLPAAVSVLLNTIQIFAASATLPISASILVDTDQIWVTNPAVLPAASSLAVNALEYGVASATLPATSSMFVDAKIYIPVFATLQATSIFAANALIAERGAAVLPLASDLSATAQIALVGRATLSINSSLSAVTIQYFIANATLALSSSLNALVSILWSSLAKLPLNSSVLVDTTIKGQVPASATLSPTSTLSCSTIQLFALQAVLPLTSSWSADSIQRGQIAASSVLAATATISSVVRQQQIATSSLSLTSSVFANTIQYFVTTARFDAISTYQVNTNQNWLAIAKLLANSTIIVDGTSFGASNVFPKLSLSSSLRANMILVQAVFHWRRHITASGSLGSKRLKGAIRRPSLTGEVS